MKEMVDSYSLEDILFDHLNYSSNLHIHYLHAHFKGALEHALHQTWRIYDQVCTQAPSKIQRDSNRIQNQYSIKSEK